MRIDLSKAAVLCDEPLDFEFRDGLFIVINPTLGIKRAYRPCDMRENIARAARCYGEFRAMEGAEIISFRGRAAG